MLPNRFCITVDLARQSFQRRVRLIIPSSDPFFSVQVGQRARGLTVGGNLIWQSEIYAVNSDFGTMATQEPYAVLGLLANFNKVTDRKYYDGLGTFSSGSYGEPRNLMFNAKWKF